jgi:hypothetical protein
MSVKRKESGQQEAIEVEKSQMSLYGVAENDLCR